MCDGELLAKCGPIVSWHWAHKVAECDPWSEPESEWHIGWKRILESLGAELEVIRGYHRADAVMPDGTVVELQSSYLSAGDIEARENHYGRMCWIYRCTWADRIHRGRRWRQRGGFWWKHGSKAMTRHNAPVFWDDRGALVRVQLNLVRTETGERVLGRAQLIEGRS